MKLQMPKISRCFLQMLIILFIAIPIISFAALSETESSGEISLEEVENELAEQGLIEQVVPEEESVDKKSKDSKPDESSMKSAIPMMEAMSDPTVTSLEDTIFFTGTSIAVPDISMEIGAAIVNYPIQVPPGRNGLTPGVSLRYNSYQKNSMVGVGWSLNIDAIQRNTRKGLDYEKNDFTHNGEPLVFVSVDVDGYGTYRPEKEQEFSTIEYLSDDSWSVTHKNGIKYTYGTTASSKQTNTHGTFQWFLDTVEDTNGNIISYTYTEDLGQVYPDTIEYVDYYYVVTFSYEQRADTIVSHAS
ncbi:MAG: hypothetical protein GY834_12630, partial [Bacteroidetes bacterium]|nr:hypothetical protein [Bacteroidota bacterium]